MGKKHIQRVRGYTVTETVIALVILGFVITGIGQFASYINTGINDLRLSKQIRWEIENAREVIGTWPVERVTTDNIDQLPISSRIAEELSDAKWKSSVAPASFSLSAGSSTSSGSIADGTSMTVAAKTVTLQLQAQYKGQSISPVELTFWVFDYVNQESKNAAKRSKLNPVKLNPAKLSPAKLNPAKLSRTKLSPVMQIRASLAPALTAQRRLHENAFKEPNASQ